MHSHYEEMRAHVATEVPLEGCGLLAGEKGKSRAIFLIRNEAESSTRFIMAAKEQLKAFTDIEREGWELLAIYHSHPNGPPHPSQTDLGESLYPGVAHLIWSQQAGEWSCLAYLLDDQRIQPLEFSIVAE
ncbi:MAG: M67 family metallopeptidase [Anaerolineales bacterium]